MTNETNQDETALVRPSQAAHLLGVSTKTIQRLTTAGALHPRTLPSGHRRYDREEVLALAKSALAGHTDGVA